MSNAALFLNDIHLGMAWTGQPITVTAEAIIAFAREFDPQPMHLDPAAATSGPFGGLIASGWHVASLVMRQIVGARPFGAAPILGLGVDELHWLRPVRPGDVLQAHGEVIEVKPSKSKPDRGVVRSAVTCRNQDGDIVLSFHTTTQLPVRM
jgi:acyl dehydratase